MLQEERDQILATNEAKINALSDYAKEILEKGAACTVGNNKLIEDNKDRFYTTEELFKQN
jgi:hypothetical protein